MTAFDRSEARARAATSYRSTSRGRRIAFACISACALLATLPAGPAFAARGGGGGGGGGGGHGGGGGGGHGGGGGGGGQVGGGGAGHFGGGGGGGRGGGGYRGGGYGYGGGWGGGYYDQPGLDFGVYGGCDPALVYRRDGRRAYAYGYGDRCY